MACFREEGRQEVRGPSAPNEFSNAEVLYVGVPCPEPNQPLSRQASYSPFCVAYTLTHPFLGPSRRAAINESGGKTQISGLTVP